MRIPATPISPYVKDWSSNLQRNLIQELEDKFAIEDEGDVSGCLGINITRPTKGTIKMNQPALAKRIVDSLGLKDHAISNSVSQYKSY